MRKLKNPVFTDNKKLLISMIILSGVMLLTTIINFGVTFIKENVALYFGFGTSYASLFSIIPLSWGVSASLLMKTKKDTFAKMPSYIFCTLAIIAFILYFIWSGGELIDNLLILMLVALAAYPFIVATLTIEGRVYNRVFATVFTSILIALTFLGGIVWGIVTHEFSLMTFFLPLMYIELLLVVFCYKLESIKASSDSDEEYSTIV